MANVAEEIATRDFGKKIINALAKKGITIVSVGMAPSTGGSFANGIRTYDLNVGQQLRTRTYLQVLAIANMNPERLAEIKLAVKLAGGRKSAEALRLTGYRQQEIEAAVETGELFWLTGAGAGQVALTAIGE